MTLRKWIVRGVVLTILGGLAAVAFVYLRWTDPAVVRQQVVAQLGQHLPGALVTLDAARLRLLGGIAISELRLTRRDDGEHNDVLYVPGGIIYHDKEQLARGRVTIRKLELHRPRFRIIRGKDGSWNTKGIIGPVDLSKSIPTIVIQQGTIFVEDRTCPSVPVLEIKDFNLTLLNDPITTLVYQATAHADVAGQLRLRGTLHRATEELEASLDVPSFPLSPALIQRLAAYAPQAAEDARHLEGTGQLHARFHYRPDSQQWDHDVRARLKQGSLRHALLPLPLEELEASAQVLNGRITLESLTAKAGTARLHAAGERESFHEDAEARGEVRVEDLLLTPDLFEKLPPALQKVHADFAPNGPIDLAWRMQAKGAALRHGGTVTLKGLSGCFEGFRYPVRNVTGTLNVDLAPEGHLAMLKADLTATANGGRPVRITGTVAGPKPAAVDVKIAAQGLPLDETLLAALPEPLQKRARSFHPRGQGDMEVFVRREPGEPTYQNRFVARFQNTAIRYDVFPYPLEQVSATLDILPDHWELHDFRGTHKGSEVTGHGKSHPLKDGSSRVELELLGKNLLLDDELKTALTQSAAAGVKPAWEAFQPTGRADFRALVDIPAGKAEPVLDVTLAARGCSILPSFFPYPLHDLTGSLRYANGMVEVRNVSARHGETVLVVKKADVTLLPGGGFFVMMPELHASGIRPDADLTQALPAPLRAGLATLQLREPFTITTEVRVDMPPEPGASPLVYWDGGILLQNATVRLGVPFEGVNGRVFCRGRHNGKQLEGVLGNVTLDQAVLFDQPLKNIHGRIEVWKDTPDILRVPELTANFFGGSLGGQARVEFGPAFRYELDLTALQVQLEQMGRHNLRDKADLAGEAIARLYLKGEGGELTGLEGGGSIDIPNGKLYNLPVLLDLLKFLSVRLPDRTAFEEAHFRFTIHGPRVRINRLELLGNAVSLGGEGQMNLDGTDMDLDLYAVWGRIMQVLPAAVKEVPPWFSKQFLKIKARGKVTDPKFDREAMPGLVEPVKGMLQRVTGSK